jgi:Uma2 family endonuclease
VTFERLGTLGGVRTVVLGPPPAEIEALIARRRSLGIDLFDEVWEGSYHMAPAPHPGHGYIETQLAIVLAPLATSAGLIGTGPFNLGERDDYRVPDRGYHRALPDSVFVPTAAIVVEVVSPDDETFAKFDFYATHGVDELVIADPADRTVRVFCRPADSAGYVESNGSGLLGISAAELTTAITWP